MSFPVWLLTLLTMTSILAVPLAEPVAVSAPECKCAAEVNDPYEEPLRFGFGPNRGLCVDSCRFRRPRSAQGTPRKGEIVVANFLHKKEFWVARVPLVGIVAVDLGFEKFLPMIAHVFLHFRVDRNHPLLLTAQDGSGRHEKVYDFALSVEGVPPKGRPYKFIESSFDQYLLAYRLLSMDDAYAWMVTHLSHHVKQYRLNLDAAASARLFTEASKIASEKSFTSVYHLFTNNCATGAVDLIEKVNDAKPASGALNNLLWLTRALPLDAPMGTIHFLQDRGVVTRDAQTTSLEIEYPRRVD